MKINTIHNTNAFNCNDLIDDNSLDSIITSPPYWQLRDYNHPEQLGQESLSDDYLNNLVSLFDLLKIN